MRFETRGYQLLIHIWGAVDLVGFVWDSGALVKHIWNAFDLEVFKIICGHSCTCLQVACNSKTVGSREAD